MQEATKITHLQNKNLFRKILTLDQFSIRIACLHYVLNEPVKITGLEIIPFCIPADFKYIF